MPKEKERKYRAQQYRKEWEKETWAHGWLTISKRGSSKAYCCFCDRDLAVGKSELITHSRTVHHVRLAKQVQSSHKMGTFFEVKNISKMKAELNLVALIARRNVSLSFMDHLVETLHCVAEDSKAVKDMKCGRTKATYLLTECLSPRAHENLVSEIKSAKAVSILCDKATDITMNKTFCVNVRCIEEQSAEPKTMLYRLFPVKADGGAEGLFQLLEEALEEDGIGWQKIVGYASDGENLMQGTNNSFLTRMKGKVPNLYVLKCYCHSFHLVASHAYATLSKTAEQLVHDLYNYFKNSPNQQKDFEEFQHFCHCEPHKILKPCQTRWLSLSACVNRILNQWDALEIFFMAEAFETKAPQPDRILNSLKSPYIKATLEFMLQIMALPQSTAAVERTFSKVNCNKTKLRNRLLVCTIEAILRVSERFPANFEVDERMQDLFSKARSTYMERYNGGEREIAEQIEQFD